MYRLLERRGESREKPELWARAPNQVWSWDITKLRGPAKWTYFSLYVVLDIFNRDAVGWIVAERDTAVLAERSKPLALLHADLGVTKAFSHPYVSDDNPFSESQFRTLKYPAGLPRSFHARSSSKSWRNGRSL